MGIKLKAMCVRLACAVFWYIQCAHSANCRPWFKGPNSDARSSADVELRMDVQSRSSASSVSTSGTLSPRDTVWARRISVCAHFELGSVLQPPFPLPHVRRRRARGKGKVGKFASLLVSNVCTGS